MSGEGGRWKESRENVVAVVERGRKWGALKAGGEERGWSEGRWREKGRQLEGVGVRA